MPGLAIVSPTKFTNDDLPRVDVSPVPSLRGALYDWSTDTLSVGERVTQWVDRASQISLHSPAGLTQAPVVTDDPQHGKVLRFDGSGQRLDASNLSLAGQRTVVLVGRLQTIQANEYMMTQGQGAGSFNLGLATNKTWLFYNGAGLGSSVVADDSVHVIVAVIDGDRSTISVDGTENRNTIGPTTASTIRLGASSSKYFATDIKRLVVLPYAASSYERAAIVSAMNERYR